MLGILLLIGPLVGAWNYFWRLAQDHNRSRFGFAFLGLGTYIGSLVLAVMVLSAIFILTDNRAIVSGWMTDIGCVAFAALCTGLLYYLLKRSWEKKRSSENDSELLDDLN